MDGGFMTIAEVSERFRMSIDTLRYYERLGLIPPVKRSKGGTRIYTELDCRWIAYIKCMRHAGISMGEKLFLDYFSSGVTLTK
jgi:DNA-binding transcriptional MerR regulator